MLHCTDVQISALFLSAEHLLLLAEQQPMDVQLSALFLSAEHLLLLAEQQPMPTGLEEEQCPV